MISCSSFLDKPQINFCNHWAPKKGSTLSSYPSSYYSIVSNPPPNISWSRRSSSVSASMFLDKGDSGEYKITASNKLGASSCFINITVERKSQSFWKPNNLLSVFICFNQRFFSPFHRSSQIELQWKLPNTRENTL